MFKYFSILVFCVTLTLACSKTTTEVQSIVPTALAGSWTAVSFDLTYTVGGGQTTTKTGVAVTQPLVVTFNADTTYTDLGVFDVNTNGVNNKYSAGRGSFLIRNDTIRIIPNVKVSTQSVYGKFNATATSLTLTIDKVLINLLGQDPALQSAVSSFDKYSIVYTYKKT